MKLHPLLAIVLAMAPGAAFAATITSATVYQHITDPNDASDPANQLSGLASANFTIGGSGINFQIGDSDSISVSTFLNNPTFSNQVNGFDPNAFADNTEIVITGILSLNNGNNAFIVGHDDGVVVNVTGIGTVLSDPGPTGLNETPFNVIAPSAGNYAFTLEYAECCGGPADLIFNINSANVGAVPEPGSMVLFGTGMLGFAGAVRRRFLTR